MKTIESVKADITALLAELDYEKKLGTQTAVNRLNKRIKKLRNFLIGFERGIMSEPILERDLAAVTKKRDVLVSGYEGWRSDQMKTLGAMNESALSMARYRKQAGIDILDDQIKNLLYLLEK